MARKLFQFSSLWPKQTLEKLTMQTAQNFLSYRTSSPKQAASQPANTNSRTTILNLIIIFYFNKTNFTVDAMLIGKMARAGGQVFDQLLRDVANSLVLCSQNFSPWQLYNPRLDLCRDTCSWMEICPRHVAILLMGIPTSSCFLSCLLISRLTSDKAGEILTE